MNRAYRYALVAGATPLVTGTAIFLLWLVTRWEGLMHAGVFTVIAGLVAFACGSMALVVYGWLAYRDPMVSRRRFWLSTLGCAALLLFNFPAALGVTTAFLAIDGECLVIVRNDSDQPLDDVRIVGGDCNQSFGSIPPQGAAECSMSFKRHGELKLHAIRGSTVIESTIDAYITSRLGGHTEITVHSDGSISIKDVDW